MRLRSTSFGCMPPGSTTSPTFRSAFVRAGCSRRHDLFLEAAHHPAGLELDQVDRQVEFLVVADVDDFAGRAGAHQQRLRLAVRIGAVVEQVGRRDHALAPLVFRFTWFDHAVASFASANRAGLSSTKASSSLPRMPTRWPVSTKSTA